MYSSVVLVKSGKLPFLKIEVSSAKHQTITGKFHLLHAILDIFNSWCASGIDLNLINICDFLKVNLGINIYGDSSVIRNSFQHDTMWSCLRYSQGSWKLYSLESSYWAKLTFLPYKWRRIIVRQRPVHNNYLAAFYAILTASFLWKDYTATAAEMPGLATLALQEQKSTTLFFIVRFLVSAKRITNKH